MTIEIRPIHLVALILLLSFATVLLVVTLARWLLATMTRHM